MDKQQYLTVSVLTKYLKRKFDFDPHLEQVYVKGEISNFKHHSSGHAYFSLKDEHSVIKAVMFRKEFANLKFKLENGMKILAIGNVTMYEETGSIQFYLKEIQMDGLGNLFIAFEQLKEKLRNEGLFLPHHKKKLPLYPSKIAVITSPTGAAIRDIITTIKRRYPIANILVVPVLVQGALSADSIVSALEQVNRIKDVKVIILGRGGGSIEDLWSFNEEKVARAIFSSKIPIISAVGHETDTTIADYVADVRAPTPTGAAELATPHILELQKHLASVNSKILKYSNGRLKREKERLKALTNSYAFRSPKMLLQEKERKLSYCLENLDDKFSQLLEKKNRQFSFLSNELKFRSPLNLIKEYNEKTVNNGKTLSLAGKNYLESCKKQFVNQCNLLSAVSPLNIMTRGYAAVSSGKKVVTSIKNVKKNDTLAVRLADGSINCKVMKTSQKKL